MANEQNLRPFTSEQNHDEAVKNGRKGGIASGKARREKARIKHGFNLLNLQLENNSCNYSLIKTKDGILLRNGQGYVMEYDQIKYVCEELLKYAEKHKDDVYAHNDYMDEEIIKIIMGEHSTNNKKNNVVNNPSHVYLMECGGKYKIGVSKNVSRRMKELDRKPFKLTLIAKSKLLGNAYELEKQLHELYDKEREGGEWFSLDQQQVQSVKEYLENL